MTVHWNNRHACLLQSDYGLLCDSSNYGHFHAIVSMSHVMHVLLYSLVTRYALCHDNDTHTALTPAPRGQGGSTTIIMLLHRASYTFCQRCKRVTQLTITNGDFLFCTNSFKIRRRKKCHVNVLGYVEILNIHYPLCDFQSMYCKLRSAKINLKSKYELDFLVSEPKSFQEKNYW